MQYQPIDVTKVVRNVPDTKTAKSLPCGSMVGDTCGGRTFNDNIAAVLEKRSYAGWREIVDGDAHDALRRAVGSAWDVNALRSDRAVVPYAQVWIDGSADVNVPESAGLLD